MSIIINGEEYIMLSDILNDETKVSAAERALIEKETARIGKIIEERKAKEK